MSRTWFDGHCPQCGKTPQLGKDGYLVCACKGVRRLPEAGVEGTVPETEMLKAHGFRFARDVRGDTYYVGSLGRIVWLYADGTWRSSPRPKAGMSFEEYLQAATLEELV